MPHQTEQQPEPIRISGDWLFNSTLECYEIAYEALEEGHRFSYGYAPIVSRNAMEAIAATQTLLRSSEGPHYGVLRADGNGFVLTEEESDEETWLIPDEQDRFDLSALGWCWGILDSSDRVIRTVPSHEPPTFL